MIVVDEMARDLPVIATDQAAAVDLVTLKNGIVSSRADVYAPSRLWRWLATARQRPWRRDRADLIAAREEGPGPTGHAPRLARAS